MHPPTGMERSVADDDGTYRCQEGHRLAIRSRGKGIACSLGISTLDEDDTAVVGNIADGIRHMDIVAKNLTSLTWIVWLGYNIHILGTRSVEISYGDFQRINLK